MAGVWVAERTYHIVVAVCINRRGLAMPTFLPPPPPHVMLLALATDKSADERHRIR